MADLSYTVGVNTSGAVGSLEKLQRTVARTNESFDTLKSALAGLAVGAAIRSAVQYADAIQDIADSTGIAVRNIVGFSKVVELNGGNAEVAQKAIYKLVTSINDAASGSKEAQSAFEDVGVTLSDLRTLSEQELLAKTIAGLGQIDEASKRIALSQKLLGKEFRNVGVAAVAAGYGSAVSGSDAYARSIEKAAAIQGKMDQAMNKFKLTVLTTIEPLADFVNKLDTNQIERFVDATVKIVAALAGISVGVRVIAALGAAVTAVAGYFALAKVGAAMLGGTVASLAIQAGGFMKAWAAASTVFGKFSAVATTVFVFLTKRLPFIIGGLARFIPIIGTIITILGALQFAVKAAFDFDIIDWFTNKVGEAYEAFKKFLGLKSNRKEGEFAPPGTSTAGAGRGGNADTLKAQQAQGDEMMRQWQEQQAAEQNKLAQIRQAEDAWKKQRMEIEKVGRAYQQQNADLIKSIDTESSYIGISLQEVEVRKAQAEIAARTRTEIQNLEDQKASLAEEDKKLIPIIDQQIAKIKELQVVQSAEAAAAIANAQKKQQAEQLRLFGVQQQIDKDRELANIQDETAKLTLTEIEKKYYDIKRAAEASALAAIQAEEARRGAPLSTQEIQDYYRTALDGVTRLQNAQQQHYEKSREWNTGWTRAMKEYVENAGDAASRAETMFKKATQGMEDAIVEFAKTGKFEWKGFLASILEEMLRSQIKATFASLFTGGGSGGSTGGGTSGSWLGRLLGFANGGTIPTNQPVLVGERGPEILSGVGGRTVIPNDKIGGGATYVTYNIQAVDAMSFKQMVARDPSFIYAVTEQGRKSLPQTRR